MALLIYTFLRRKDLLEIQTEASFKQLRTFTMKLNQPMIKFFRKIQQQLLTENK